MKTMNRNILLAAAALCLSASAVSAKLVPSGMFGDNAILQRNAWVPVWGKATPGAEVMVSFHGSEYKAAADASGRWEVRLSPMEATYEPDVLEISGEGETFSYENILVGDVWFASGQSNMAYYMKEGVSGGPAELENAKYPGIRFRVIEPAAKSLPAEDTSHQDWVVCSPETVGDLSAVSYYFVKNAHEDLDIPVGVIVSAVGASGIGCWMSRESLLNYPPLRAQTLAFDTDPVKWDKRIRTVDSLTAASGDILAKAKAGLDAGVHKVKYDDSSWDSSIYPTDVPKMGYPGFWGLIWARKSFEMTAAQAKQKWQLHIPMIVSSYRAYFNGKMVKDSYTSLADMEEQVIDIPAKTLKKGDNVLALRLWVIWALARIGDEGLPCYLLAEDGSRIDLTGEWRHNASLEPEVYRMQDNYWFESTALYNGMVAPVIPYAISGFLWYQGEANNLWGEAYSEMQPLMANDWRIRWGQGYLPFLYVQLAAYDVYSELPLDKHYMAEFRDWQTTIMDKCQNSYMACAIDAGEEMNIHPRAKAVVGERLYATYKKHVLGSSTEGDSPRVKAATREGDVVRVSFDNAADGLITKDSSKMSICAALCSEDGTWAWADVRLEGSDMIVTSKEVSNPVRVQYGWQGTPVVPIYNAEGYPVLPFNIEIR